MDIDAKPGAASGAACPARKYRADPRATAAGSRRRGSAVKHVVRRVVDAVAQVALEERDAVVAAPLLREEPPARSRGSARRAVREPGVRRHGDGHGQRRRAAESQPAGGV